MWRQLTKRAPVAKGRILLVEDDPKLIPLLVDAVSAAGYPVVVTDTGRFAQEVVRAYGGLEAFRVAIVDFHLPDMDGTEFARKINEDYPDMKILMITGDPDPVRRLISDFCMPWRLLSKPFRQAQLLEEIEGLTGESVT